MAFSKYGQYVLVTQERSLRRLSVERLPNKSAATVRMCLSERLAALPRHLRRSLTFDNGTEFALHYKLSCKLSHGTFFCDLRAPWQKGGIENAIGRMRRSLPRKTDLATIPADQLDALVARYNDTPRKCLAFKTPNEVFCDILNPVALQS